MEIAQKLLMSFSVMYICEKGYDNPVRWTTSCKALEKVGNYDLTQEDATIFLKADHSVPREWKDIPLPKVTQAVPAASPSTRSEKEGPSGGEVMSDKVKELLAVHHTYVDVLLSMGVDPIKDYEDKKAENILSRVKTGDTRCQVCDKRCSSTQKLKNHIRRRHIGKTPYQCGECECYYGDSQSLKIHMKKHNKEGEESQKHTCEACGKSYPTKGKLNEHLEKHQDIRCQYCNSSFAYNRTKAAHELESCPDHPGASGMKQKKKKKDKEPKGEPPVAEKCWHCHLCAADYGTCRNLKKHLNTHHGGAEVARDVWR